VSDLVSPVVDQVPEGLRREADVAALWRKVVRVYLELRRAVGACSALGLRSFHHPPSPAPGIKVTRLLAEA
jgi:hypothetical protein